MPTETDRRAARVAMQFGLGVWGTIAVTAWVGWLRFGLIEILFLAAVWVIVPAGILMVPRIDSLPSNLVRRSWLVFFAAASASAGFSVEPGRLAGALVIPWVMVCGCIAWEGARRIVRFRLTNFSQYCFAAGEGYLAVGGVWLLMSRFGMHPAGFQEPIVLLTAVHFHFAGFLTGLLAGLAWHERLPRGRTPLQALITGAILGPGLLGLAFLAGPKFKLGAMVLIVVGQCAIAATMARIGIRRSNQSQG